MNSKRIFRFIVLGIAGALLSCGIGCRGTRTSEAESTPLSDGEYTARINDLELWYKVAGEGPVCLHPTPGWGPSSELYYLKLTPMEELFTMVYLDTRGSGRSQRPELTEYTRSNFVADLEGLRRHLGVDRMWLMGHSDGGPMVLHYAYEYPDRVKGLILVDTPLGDTSKDEERSKRMQARKGEPWFDAAMARWGQMPKTQAEFETYMQAILPFFFASTDNLEKQADVFSQMSLSFHASQGQGQSERSSVDLVPWLSEMDIPTLVIVGSDDFICPPSAAQFLHSEISTSKLLVIEQVSQL